MNDTCEHVRVAVDNLWRANGRAPTLREIGAVVNRAPATVSYALRALAARGDITLTKTRAGRRITAMRDMPTYCERIVMKLHRAGLLSCDIQTAIWEIADLDIPNA